MEHLIWVGDQQNIATGTENTRFTEFGGETMGMTLAELTKAIQQHIDLDMDAEVAQGMAEHALGFFGFYNRIIDNALEPTDRNLFYMFQDYDLLTTESEETTLWDGREWRIHYWKFKPDLRERVEAYMQRNLQEEVIDPSPTSTPPTAPASGRGREKRWPTPTPSPPTGERDSGKRFSFTAATPSHASGHRLGCLHDVGHSSTSRSPIRPLSNTGLAR